MINKIQFLRGTKTKWDLQANQERIISKGSIAIEYTISEQGVLETVKLKFGYDLPYASTPYVGDGEAILPPDNVLFDGDTLYTLNAQGERVEFNLIENLTIDDLLSEDQNVISDEQVLNLNKLSAIDATLDVLTTSQQNKNTGEALNPSVTLSFNVINKQDIKDLVGGRVSVDAGSWNGLLFDLKAKTSHTITSVGVNTINTPRQVTFSLFAINKYNKEYLLAKSSSSFKARVYYGFSTANNITNPSSLLGLNTLNILNLVELTTLDFNHNNVNAYDYILIEKTLESNLVDIRDYELQGTPNSFDMTKSSDISFGGKLFSVYISNSKSSGNLKAVIK